MMSDNHTSDDSDARIAQREAQVAEIVARCGNIYTRFRLSPPMALRAAAQHWVGLSSDEVARVVEDHLREHRRLYIAGAGDRFFYMVEAAIRKAIEAKHPSRDDELERPRRRSSNRVQQVHNASGFPDAFVEGRAARQVRRTESERPSLAGYTGDDRVGVPSLEDDEADA
jgi:hypothetical protein